MNHLWVVTYRVVKWAENQIVLVAKLRSPFQIQIALVAELRSHFQNQIAIAKNMIQSYVCRKILIFEHGLSLPT